MNAEEIPDISEILARGKSKREANWLKPPPAPSLQHLIDITAVTITSRLRLGRSMMQRWRSGTWTARTTTCSYAMPGKTKLPN